MIRKILSILQIACMAVGTLLSIYGATHRIAVTGVDKNLFYLTVVHLDEIYPPLLWGLCMMVAGIAIYVGLLCWRVFSGR